MRRIHPALLIFCVAVLAGIARRLARWRRRPSPRLGVDPSALHDTIQVVLVFGPSDPAAVLDSLFQAAAVPARVFVTVYDEGAAASAAPELQRNVRIARRMGLTSGRPFHRGAARAWATERMHTGERFTLLLRGGAVLLPGWDATLVGALAEHPAGAVLTTAPARPSAADPRPTFLRLAAIRGARLALRPRRAAQAPGPGEPLPSLFWSPDLSFCASGVLQPRAGCPLPGGCCSERMEATLGSLLLWTHGFSFFAPPRAVATAAADAPALRGPRRPAAAGPPPPGGEEPAPPRRVPGLQRTLAQYEAFAGVSLARSEASPRARAGLSPNPTAAERVAKYGSVESTRLRGEEGLGFSP